MATPAATIATRTDRMMMKQLQEYPFKERIITIIQEETVI